MKPLPPLFCPQSISLPRDPEKNALAAGAADPSGKKTEIANRVAANFAGWEKDNMLFDRELEKVIRALRTEEAGREKPPSPRL